METLSPQNEKYQLMSEGASLRDEEIHDLLMLVEQKDADLRSAAELGKMLLDEKEQDAEAHEGEKKALWRRIQEMARRVVELEQEAAESRALSQQDASCSIDKSTVPTALVVNEGGDGGGERAEERALRAKNEMLERQLEHMRDSVEETQLEVAAAKKALFRRSSRRSSVVRRRDSSFGAVNRRTPSPAARSASRGRTTTSPSAAAARMSRSNSRLSSRRRSFAASGLDPPLEDGAGQEGNSDDDDDANSVVSEDALRTADLEHESSWREENAGRETGGSEESGLRTLEEDDRDTDWLIEQNAWLMEEIESKDELIAALRQQLDHQQRLQGQPLSASFHPIRKLTASDDSDDSNDDDDSENENASPGFGNRERSFLDALRDSSEGTLCDDLASPSSKSERAVNDGVKAQNDEVGPDSTPVERFFGGRLEANALTEFWTPNGGVNVGMSEKGGVGGNAAGEGEEKIVQSKHVSPLVLASRENSPIKFGSVVAFSPLRRRSIDQPKALVSPAVGVHQGFGGVTGVVTQELFGDDDDVAVNDENRENSSPCSRKGASPLRRLSPVMWSDKGLPSPLATMGSSVEWPDKNLPSPVPLSRTPRVVQKEVAAGVALPSKESIPEGSGIDVAEAEEEEEEPKEVVDGVALPARESVPGSDGVAEAEDEEEEPKKLELPVEMSNASCTSTPAPSSTLPSSSTVVAVVEESVTATVVIPAVSKRAAKVEAAKAKMAAAAEATSAKKASEAAAKADSRAAAQNRAERKSRQAMEKLGLRTVDGVFRMTMRTSSGVVFVVKSPDVFKHPQQDTYVVFGTADMDRSGSEVGPVVRKAASRPASSAATSSSREVPRRFIDTATATTAATPNARLAWPDAEEVEVKSVSAGLDPADVLTILSHASCSPERAIEALLQAGGDVVNAVMNLTGL